MAVTYGFYDSKPDSSRKYNALEMSSIFDGIIEDGVFEHYAGKMAVTAGSGMHVIVATGRAWFDHTWTLNDAELSLSIDSAATGQKRKDAVVIEVNRSSRVNSIKVVKGTAGSTTPPTLTNTENVKQHPLAYVNITGSAITSIEPTVPSITPWVTAPLQSISIASQIAAWQAAWADKLQDEYTLNVVRYDQEQSLTSTQKKRARINIDAAARSSIANNYSSSTTYKVGQYVYFDGNLHRSKVSNNKGHEPLNTSSDAYWSTATTFAGAVLIMLEQEVPAANQKIARSNISAVSYGMIGAKKWEPNKSYVKDDILVYNDDIYRVGTDVQSTDSFPAAAVYKFPSFYDYLWHLLIAKNNMLSGIVIYSSEQNLTLQERLRARTNIGIQEILNKGVVSEYDPYGTYRSGQFILNEEKVYCYISPLDYSPNGSKFIPGPRWREVSLGDAMATVVRADIRQNLTEEEKTRARANLDITSVQDAVSYNAQDRTDEQQLQARRNIGFNGNFVNTGYSYISMGSYIEEFYDTYDTFEEYLIRYPDIWPAVFPTTIGETAKENGNTAYTFWAYDCFRTGPSMGEETGLMFLEFTFVGDLELPPDDPCDRFCKVTKYNFDGSYEQKLYFNTTLLSHVKTDENGTEFLTTLVNQGEGSQGEGSQGEARTDVSDTYFRDYASIATPEAYLSSLSAGKYILTNNSNVPYYVCHADNVSIGQSVISTIRKYTEDPALYEYCYVDGILASAVQRDDHGLVFLKNIQVYLPVDDTDATNKFYVDTTAGNMQSIAYSALKTLRDTGKLVPGKQYRITDYVCTTTQSDTRVVSHPFDIIVTADSESALNENARACLHSNDTYYTHVDAKSDLTAWELKYCLDNDTQRFSWADEINGKGVVYWMRDDWGNECPYDFKQIQFKRYKLLRYGYSGFENSYYAGEDCLDEDEQPELDSPVWVYTFCILDGQGDAIDMSVFQRKYVDDENIYNTCHNNVIGMCIALDLNAEAFIFCIPDNAFVTDSDFTADLSEVVLPHNNTVGNNSTKNTFTGHTTYNILGDGCTKISLGEGSSRNVFDSGCHSIALAYGHNNSFSSNCSQIYLEHNSRYNRFDATCSNIYLGEGSAYNTFDIGCGVITLSDGCGRNTFGIGCYGVTLCRYCKNCVFENDVSYVTVVGSESSPSNLVQNYHILAGTKGASASSRINIGGDYNLAYCTYVGKNSSGVVKTWAPADLVE